MVCPKSSVLRVNLSFSLLCCFCQLVNLLYCYFVIFFCFAKKRSKATGTTNRKTIIRDYQRVVETDVESSTRCDPEIRIVAKLLSASLCQANYSLETRCALRAGTTSVGTFTPKKNSAFKKGKSTCPMLLPYPKAEFFVWGLPPECSLVYELVRKVRFGIVSSCQEKILFIASPIFLDKLF